MAATYDTSTDVGKVRAIIGDTDVSNAHFQDGDLEAFLAIEENVLKLAAAMALDSMASNQAYIQKKTKVGDVSTDGPALAKALREHAANLRSQVDSEAAFDWAEMGLTSFNRREILNKDAMRDG